MRKVKIITDSCADLSAEQLEKYDIDYARMSTDRGWQRVSGASHMDTRRSTQTLRDDPWRKAYHDSAGFR